MNTLDIVMMYWGYFTAFCFIVGFSTILPLLKKSADDQIPASKLSKNETR